MKYWGERERERERGREGYWSERRDTNKTKKDMKKDREHWSEGPKRVEKKRLPWQRV